MVVGGHAASCLDGLADGQHDDADLDAEHVGQRLDGAVAGIGDLAGVELADGGLVDAGELGEVGSVREPMLLSEFAERHSPRRY